MTPVKDGISVNHDLLYENSQKLVQMIAIRRSKSLQSNTDIFDGDMTSSNFVVMLNNAKGS